MRQQLYLVLVAVVTVTLVVFVVVDRFAEFYGLMIQFRAGSWLNVHDRILAMPWVGCARLVAFPNFVSYSLATHPLDVRGVYDSSIERPWWENRLMGPHRVNPAMTSFPYRQRAPRQTRAIEKT